VDKNDKKWYEWKCFNVIKSMYQHIKSCVTKNGENNNVSSAYSKRKVFISTFKYSSKRLSIVCKDGAS
jgi:hypothetical protein